MTAEPKGARPRKDAAPLDPAALASAPEGPPLTPGQRGIAGRVEERVRRGDPVRDVLEFLVAELKREFPSHSWSGVYRAEGDALGLGPFRRPICEYFAICDSYYQAIRKANAAEIETIDMARRGVHNEAAELLLERLEGKVETDFATARRLFTLICVLHIRG